MDRSTMLNYLLDYEDRRALGQSPTPAELGADSPTQVAELEDAIARLQRLEPILELTSSDPVEGGPPEVFPFPFGRYEIRGLLGEGGTARVYRAWDPVLGIELALKRLKPCHGILLPDHLLHLWRRDAQTLARLRHEAIVRVYEAGDAGGVPYLAMEYVSGGSLHDHLPALRAAGPQAWVRIMERVARAVGYAHAHKVCHRDLKPRNILLGLEQQPFVTDFGLAKLLGEPARASGEGHSTNQASAPPGSVDEGSTTLSLAHHHPGTAQYMAPEQYDANLGLVGPPADVWALGVILYELLTGQRPFAGGSRADLHRAVCHEVVSPPRQIEAGVDRGLEAIVLRCLNKLASKRPANGNELAAALLAWQQRGRTRRQFLCAGLAGAAVAAGGGAIAFLSPIDPERAYRRRVAPLMQTLTRQGKLDLLTASADGKVAAMVRDGKEATKLRHPLGELALDTALDASLVELLPAIPSDRFTLRVEVRCDWTRSTRASIGIYCKYAGIQTTNGPQHYVHGLFLSEDGQNNACTMCLEQRWYGELNAPTDQFRRNLRQAANGEEAQNRMRCVVPGTSLGRWWELTLRVSPTEVIATGRPLDRKVVPLPKLGPLTPADRNQFLGIIRRRFRDVPGPTVAPLKGDAVGLFVAAGAYTVRCFDVILDSE